MFTIAFFRVLSVMATKVADILDTSEAISGISLELVDDDEDCYWRWLVQDAQVPDYWYW